MNYLYALQNFRESAPHFITVIIFALSEASLYLVPVILALIYWIYDKKLGYRLFFGMAGANFAVNTTKVFACIYRPWVSDPRLHVDPIAAKNATGYSFPSAHVAMATSGFGSIAMLKRRNKAIAIICVSLIVITAFGRNFLGAHTLNDVVAAFLIAVVAMYLIRLVTVYAEKHPDKAVPIALLGLLLCVIAAIVVEFKDYPIDYDAAGNILADPEAMIEDAYACIGLLAGALLGFIIESKFIDFSVETDKKGRICRAVFGTLSFALYYTVISKKICYLLPLAFGKLMRQGTSALFITVLVPLAIKLIQKKRGICCGKACEGEEPSSDAQRQS